MNGALRLPTCFDEESTSFCAMKDDLTLSRALQDRHLLRRSRIGHDSSRPVALRAPPHTSRSPSSHGAIHRSEGFLIQGHIRHVQRTCSRPPPDNGLVIFQSLAGKWAPGTLRHHGAWPQHPAASLLRQPTAKRPRKPPCGSSNWPCAVRTPSSYWPFFCSFLGR